MPDLQEAINAAQKAVDFTPPDHPDRATSLNTLGSRLRDLHMRTNVIEDLERAIEYHSLASEQANARIIARMHGSASVLRCYAVTETWEEAYRAACSAVQLIPVLTPRWLGNNDRSHALRQLDGLGSAAAAVALNAGKEPYEALSLLELGRFVLAGSIGDLRTDVMELEARHPELAMKFNNLREQLSMPDRHDNRLEASSNTGPPLSVENRHKADAELSELITVIRKEVGFEDFLLPPTKQEVKVAAASGPLVVINVSTYRCDAILIEQDDIRLVRLPKLSEQDIREKTPNLDEGHVKHIHHALEWLWDVIAEPVLEALGFTQLPHDDNWPCIWWIPTGPLVHFPLHAAGYHRQGSTQTVLDRAISSYSPSVKALLHSRRRRVQSITADVTKEAVFVAMGETPRQRNLRFAAQEIRALRDICESMGLVALEPRRRREDVLLQIQSCQIFHFAGHGHTSELDPSLSCLLLDDWEDDPLTVADLLDINLYERSPYLAFLSACGTGQIKQKKLADESMHLISGCQLAGFRHVVGTLWQVSDRRSLEVSRASYEMIKEEGMDDNAVSRGLHRALRSLRYKKIEGKMLNAASRQEATSTTSNAEESVEMRKGTVNSVRYESNLYWVPYVHFGP